jgi:RNA polymerase II-associated factor 1
LDNGELPPHLDVKRGGKGAYYKNIERKMILKKKRVNVRLVYIYSCPHRLYAIWQINEAYPNKWEVVNVMHTEMDQEEQDEREEALAEVMDPLFMLRGEVDADGDVDVTFGAEETDGVDVTPEEMVDI